MVDLNWSFRWYFLFENCFLGRPVPASDHLDEEVLVRLSGGLSRKTSPPFGQQTTFRRRRWTLFDRRFGKTPYDFNRNIGIANNNKALLNILKRPFSFNNRSNFFTIKNVFLNFCFLSKKLCFWYTKITFEISKTLDFTEFWLKGSFCSKINLSGIISYRVLN